MQTRRDQLQAYRFQNRRALAALVTGEPNVVEPPMRRLTVTTISGIMIAILIAVGFALFGLIKPSGGDDWKQAGAIIVENETGARFVYLDEVLHPVLNYPSAVLALGANQKSHVVHVGRSDLKGARRGVGIGIPGIPDSLPSASNLTGFPWSVCSRLQAGATNGLIAHSSVQIGSDLDSAAVPASSGIVVQSVPGTDYLLYGGRRLEINGVSVTAALQLQSAEKVTVATAFLDGVPAGPPLRTPDVPSAGARYAQPIDGRTALVGQLLHVTDNDQFYVVLPDGVAAVTPLESQLLQTVPLAGGKPLPPLDTPESTAITLTPSPSVWASKVAPQFAGLPNSRPTLSDAAGQNTGTGGICAVYRAGSDLPRFAVPGSTLPTYQGSAVTESATSSGGHADGVVLPPGRAALAKSGDGSTTTFVISDPGRKYAAASVDVLSALGYGTATASAIPSQVLALLVAGPALDPTAARQPVSG